MQQDNPQISFMADDSFSSVSSSSSYDIEVDVGRDVLTQICCGQLSRILDFPDSKLETLLGEDEADEAREDHIHYHLAKNISSGLKHMKRSIEKGIHSFAYHRQGLTRIKEPDGPVPLIFGSSLQKDNSLVILQLIDHMSKHTSVEGVFRKPGNKLRVSQLVEELCKGRLPEVLQDSVPHPHDLASVLKQYFSELQEPLLLTRHQDAYLQVAGLQDSSVQLKCLQLLVLMLPVLHRLVLQHLLGMLRAVSSNPLSKMDAHSLAVVFAPNLIWPPAGAINDILSGNELNMMVSLVEKMIENHIDLFDVPAHVQLPARRYLKRKQGGELDAAIDIPGTYCQQSRSQDFHVQGRERMVQEMALLYELVQKMPEGSRKHHLLKRFEHNHHILGTPKAFIVSKKRKSSTSSTPSRVTMDEGVSSQQVEVTEHEPHRKRLRTQSSIELMKLRIQSSSSDQDPITTPDTPVMQTEDRQAVYLPYKVTPV